jgi:hypothetical protein
VLFSIGFDKIVIEFTATIFPDTNLDCKISVAVKYSTGA